MNKSYLPFAITFQYSSSHASHELAQPNWATDAGVQLAMINLKGLLFQWQCSPKERRQAEGASRDPVDLGGSSEKVGTWKHY
jgi:hypothetical protein